jgi:hypothetical protein
MPLDKSGSKEAVGTNIGELTASGRPRKQAIAIALDVQRKAGANAPPPRTANLDGRYRVSERKPKTTY